MIKLIPIDDLKVGMFVQADVEVGADDEEVRYFLAPRNAVYATESTKKARLLSSRYKQISAEGGLLIASSQFVETLRNIGASLVFVDTERSDRLLGLDELTDADVGMDSGDGDGEEEEGGSALEATETFGARQSFGEAGKAWMEVAIAEDALEATLQKMTAGGDGEIEGEDLRDGLEEGYGIREGVDEDLLGELVDQARAEPELVISGDYTIARGQSPVVAEPGKVEFHFLEGLDPTKFDYSGLKAAFSETDLNNLLTRQIVARLVVPGEKMATVGATVPAKLGRDVHGNVVNAEPALRPGPNVEVSEDCYYSRIYGYACLLGNQLSALSPIWMSSDRMEAYFVYFPRLGADAVPEREWLLELLDVSKITHGFDDTAIDKLCGGLPPPDRAASLRLARGIPPVRGGDVTVNYLFASERETVEFGADGEAQLYVSSYFPAVEAGQLLGEIVPPTVGEAGIDLSGRTVPSPAGSRELYRANDNVDLVYERGQPKYFTARIAGIAGVFSHSLSVSALMEVEGDVDESRGSIEFDGCVLIRGSVSAGCEVEASGRVAVLGRVEEGAQIRAHGDVVVAQGIFGGDTCVVAAGNVQTKLIQDASVSASAGVVCGSYLRDARVRAGGNVVVSDGGGRLGGSIVGGETFATTGLIAGSIGTDAISANIGIDPDPQIAIELTAAEREIDRCSVHIAKIHQTLKLGGLEAEDFKAIISRTPVPKRPKLISVLRQLKKLIEKKTLQERQHGRYKERMAATMNQAEIAISGRVHAGVTVAMADQQLTTERDLDGVAFFSKPGVGQGVGYRQD